MLRLVYYTLAYSMYLFNVYSNMYLLSHVTEKSFENRKSSISETPVLVSTKEHTSVGQGALKINIHCSEGYSNVVAGDASCSNGLLTIEKQPICGILHHFCKVI